MGLVHELGAVDNVGLVLGYDRSRVGIIQWRRQARRTSELLATFGIRLNPRTPLSRATPVERTAVAIVRAIAGWQKGRGLLVLDEPTAALPAREVDELFKLIREIRDSGTAVLLVSHRLDEVMAICDHATVMSAGQVIWDGGTHDMSVAEFAKLIAGNEDLALDTSARAPYEAEAGSRAVLEVNNLSGRYLHDVSFSVHPGEVVGVAGLLGSGREELPYVVAGAVQYGVSGQIIVDGSPLAERSVQAARAHGVVLVPAERASEAIVGEFSVRENVTLAGLPEIKRGPMLLPGGDRAYASKWLRAVDANPKVSENRITTLSGGNQQKAVLARWLSVNPKLLALSEPTAGIDIGARTTIYAELRSRAEQGLSVLMSSSDPEDLIAVCHRVLVLRDGRVMTELVGPQITKRAIATAMEGVHSDHV
jgi:ribose transport system ATP-binding protein